MKKPILKFFAFILLAFSVCFSSSALFSPAAFAVEEDDDDDEVVILPIVDPEDREDDDDDDDEVVIAPPVPTPGDLVDGGKDKDKSEKEEDPPCQKESDSVSWFLCPVINAAGRLTDSFYGLIEGVMVVEPLTTDRESAVFLVWQAMRNLTNIVFIIFSLIVIYSQITGAGISNYGVKRVLPRLIIAVMLVNLSYFICSIAVDVSNIIGSSIGGWLGGIQDSIITKNVNLAKSINAVSWSEFTRALTAGGAFLGVAITAYSGVTSVFWAVVLALIGAIISLAIGLVTISLRQALVVILIMISPLAFVAYLLPNTEKWFEQWKKLLFQMLFFYPMFAFLFGASKLAGWAILASADGSLLQILVGLTVQVIPIFLAFTLFKMSGTVLGSINAALQKASMPARASLSDWAASHQEKARQTYVANDRMPGAKLRSYLDYRKQLRELDTEAANALRKNRALERAYTRSASHRGVDAEGNDVFGGIAEGFANSHTNLQKRAAIQATLATNAQQNLANSLGEYNRIFQNRSASVLSGRHDQAFLQSMKQQFRAENIAQNDQNLLLGNYLNAQTSQIHSPYQYNNLIKSAGGGLGHLGEASIMGQVIVRSAEIEGRRRREALIMKNKFNLSKSDYRGMVFNKAHINDNGYETDENGLQIEDDQYRLIPSLAHKHQEWQYYIGVHNTTGNEITKEEYDALSSSERKEYRKVRYMNILDDNNNIVQKVFDDDNGYMKELLINDIAIGDPINRRYNISYGLPQTPGGEPGILRKYHSTISAAMLDTKYKEHAVEVNPMTMAQANMGYLDSIGKYNIANMQSSVAFKASALLQNDGYVFKDWSNLLNSMFNESEFRHYFPDIDIDSYPDVNGIALDGYRLAMRENGEYYWKEINHNDPTLTLDEKKNFIKHKIAPKFASRLVGLINREITPGVLENQKPDSLKGLKILLDTLQKIGLKDADPTTAFVDRLDPDGEIFKSNDPKVFKQRIAETQAAIDAVSNQEQSVNEMIAQVRARDAARHVTDNDEGEFNINDVIQILNRNYGDSDTSSNKNGGKSGKSRIAKDGTVSLSPDEIVGFKALAKFLGSLEKSNETDDIVAASSNIDNIMENIDGFYKTYSSDIVGFTSNVLNYCHENTELSKYYEKIEELVGQYRYAKNAESTEEGIQQTGNKGRALSESERINKLYHELSQFIYGISPK